MKKNIILTALALAATVTVGAKTADELRVYINPGHGGWTANDRPCTLVGHGAFSRTNTDTLSFFESNTDLEKGFGVLERLIQYGLKFDRTLNQTGDNATTGAARDLKNNIVMSRVKNGPYHEDNGTESQLGEATPADLYVFNRSLSEISAEVEANNFDMFISIHSNAADEGTNTNFPLFLYRGYDTPTEDTGVTLEHQNLSRAMAAKCWPYAIENTHMMWTAYANGGTNFRGDIDFYHSSSTSASGCKGYLGVLKHHVPGFLVEGYFHTYQPARHRAMNWDVCRVEGDAYAHGIADYFGLTKESTGTIYGVVRDKHEKFKDPAYTPNMTTADAYKPLNGVTAILKKAGTEVARYTTDDYYNGAFVFDGIEPGDYTIEFEAEGYKPIEEPVAVTVKAASVVYPTASLVSETWTPPAVVYENYPDPAAAQKGVYVPDEIAFEQTYVDEPIAQLADKNVRRVIAYNGKLYILALDKAEKPNATIIVYDPVAKTVLAEVSTEGTEGTEKNVSDIQVTSDGVLVACAKELCQYSDNQVDAGFTRGEHNVYKWANDENGLPTGAPVKWFSSKRSGNMYRAYVGETMAYTGTSTEGTIMVPAQTTASTTNLFYNVYTIVDGEFIADGYLNQVNDWSKQSQLGDYTLVTSPLDPQKVLVVSSKKPVYEISFNDAKTYTEAPEGVANVNAAGAFRFRGHSYMVAPDNAEGNNGGVKLVEVTDGVNKAQNVATTNTSVAAVAANAATAANVDVVTDVQTEEVTAAYLNLYAVRDGKVSRFTTKGVTATIEAAAYAYGLSSKDNDETVDITYHATGAAPKAELVLNDGKKEIVVPMGAAVKGENNYTLTKKDLLDEKSEYTWEVRLTNKTIPTSGLVKSLKATTPNEKGYLPRASVLTITDPAQPSFGYTAFAGGRAQGLTIYDPEGNEVATDLFKNHTLWGGNNGGGNASNPFRGGEREGKFVFTAWGDGASGVTYVDPLDLDAGLQNMYAGEKQSSGAYIYNGVNVGGGHSGLCFVGKGDNTRMYAFSEDHDTSIAPSNALLYWELGSAWQITMAPKATGEKGRWANTNCDLVPYGDGLFMSQCRSAGNNSAGCPVFCYIGTDNAVKYNSGNEEDKTWINSGNSAIAISPDGKTFVLATYGNFLVMDVAWKDGAPTMTKRFEFAPTMAGDWGTARFDYAGNLHYYTTKLGKYEVYAIAQEHPVVTTPALATDIIKGGSSAVEDLYDEAVDAEAPVLYYNLQGIQVAADNLTPGVYVRVQGKKATKVVIK